MLKKEDMLTRAQGLVTSLKSIALATNDMRWQSLQEGRPDSWDELAKLCANLEEAVQDAIRLQTRLEEQNKTVKKKTLLSILG
jgi:hypothetical protein